MKKIYLSVLAVMCYGAVTIAQPTLTQANFVPNIGDSQLYYIADTNSVVDPAVGPNTVFYYNMLQGYGQTQTQHFVNPASTPNSGDFPTATYTDTTAGFPGNLKYDQDFTDSLSTIGLVLEINTFGSVIAKYDNDPETYMKFPFNYGDSFSDNYGGQFTSVAAPLPTNGNGTVTVTADAWGTLKLPMGVSIDSVLRVVRVENLLTDTIFLQPLFPDIMPIPVNATQISYYKPSISKNPLLSFVTADINGDTSVNVISQYPLYTVGINEQLVSSENVSMFPNPTNSDFTTLSFITEDNVMGKINIINTLGQNIKEVFSGEFQKGDNNIKIKTTDLNKGLYFVNIIINDNIISKKLIIE